MKWSSGLPTSSASTPVAARNAATARMLRRMARRFSSG